jgi:predicted phage terminase large subunit-like protein
MLREYVANKVYIPGIAHKAADTQPRNSKSARLETLQPLFAQGNVFVKKEMEDFISELVLYPMAKNDDTLDAFYYAVIKNYPPTHGEEKAVGNKKVKERYYDWMLS